MALACGKGKTHDAAFAGSYRGALKAQNILFEANTPERKQMEQQMLQAIEDDWKSGRTGLTLDVLEGGRFKMRFWMPGSSGEGPVVPPMDHTSEGRWWNDGDVLVLRSDSFSPFFFTRVTRQRFRRTTLDKREKELQLKRSEDGRLSNLTDLTFERK